MAIKSSFSSLALLLLGCFLGYELGIISLPPEGRMPLLKTECGGDSLPRHASAGVSPLFRHLGFLGNAREDKVWATMFESGVTNKVVIDVGVYWGDDFTVPAARAGHTVYAFEPTRDKHPRIRANVEAAGLIAVDVNLTACAAAGKCGAVAPSAPVMLFRAAAGERTRTASIVVTANWQGERDPTGHFGGLDTLLNEETVKYSPFSEEVPEVRVDEVFPPDLDVYVFKIDAQGFDGVVLRGSEDLFASNRVSIVVIEFWPAEMARTSVSASETLEFLGRHNFLCFDWGGDVTKGVHLNVLPLEPLTGTAYVREFPSLDHLTFGSGPFTDLICVHRNLLDEYKGN